MNKKEILEIIINCIYSFEYHKNMLNERYFHHYFTYKIQKNFNLLDLSDQNFQIKLHHRNVLHKLIACCSN